VRERKVGIAVHKVRLNASGRGLKAKDGCLSGRFKQEHTSPHNTGFSAK
jgi:hypothetical protein